MANVADGKVNLNVNIKRETGARIDELTQVTPLNKGGLIDLAVMRLYADLKAGKVELTVEPQTSGCE